MKTYQEVIKIIYAPDNRCWWTCIDLIRKTGNKNLIFVEGTADGHTHYWVRDGKEILDPHYDIIGSSATEYKEERTFTAKEILSKIDFADFEIKHAERLNGDETFNKKVYTINI